MWNIFYLTSYQWIWLIIFIRNQDWFIDFGVKVYAFLAKKDKINMHNNFVILQTDNQICLHIVLKIFFSVESIKIWQFKYARCFLFCLRRRLRYLVVANVLSMVYPFSSLVLIFNLHLRICGIPEETLHKYSWIISFWTCTIKF